MDRAVRYRLPGAFNDNPDVLTLNPALVKMEPLGTEGLLDKARAGDADAFCELCRTYETPLLRHAIALCGEPSLAEDLAQDSLVEAWKCLRRYSGRCQFFTWLCAILLNRHRNVLRRRRSLRIFSFSGRNRDEIRSSLGKLADQGPRPDEAAQHHEQAALVRTCVQALPPKHREVIYLRFYVDDSLEGIAAALGCSVGTVKSRLFHALEKLRAMHALSAHLVNLKTNGDIL